MPMPEDVNVTTDGDKITISFERAAKNYGDGTSVSSWYTWTTDTRQDDEDLIDFQERIAQEATERYFPLKKAALEQLGIEYVVDSEGFIRESDQQEPTQSKQDFRPTPHDDYRMPSDGGSGVVFQIYNNGWVSAKPTEGKDSQAVEIAAKTNAVLVRKSQKRDGSGYYYKSFDNMDGRDGNFINFPRYGGGQRPQPRQDMDEPF